MFEGYSDKTVDFFWELRFHNDREWFRPRKEEFYAVIQNPTKELGGEIYDWFMEQYPQLNLNLHISRIYRDARRLFGRGPFKDHIWFSLQNEIENREEAPCFWFELGCDGYGYGVGSWSGTAGAAQKWRKLIDNDPKIMEKLARDFQKQDVFALEGQSYAKSKGHGGELIADWYNKKTIALSCSRAYDTCAYSRELVQMLKDGFTFLMPYYLYLDKAYRAAE